MVVRSDISIPRQRVPDLSLPLSVAAIGGCPIRSPSTSRCSPSIAACTARCAGIILVSCSRCMAPSVSGASRQSPSRLTTPSARARPKRDGGLKDLCVAYALSLRQAREWGLYVSRGCGVSSLGIEEPPMFVEPALFLIRPDRTLYYASVQSMSFGRPCFEQLLDGIEKAVARQYPARGELTDWEST